ncbi:MAG: hypothetical protein KAQ79_05040, partial [Cyclobacteriaceae bacterium]|nr:hypothetical protein [Cyclobacteriaceae bacterium]
MRRSYRNRNPHTQDKTKEPFFNNKTKSKTGDSKPFFQTKGLKVDSPGDKYEQEADSMAKAVVNQAASKPQIQQKEMGAIQRESLATPLEDEKLGTAEQRMEEDKMIQEKPEVQREEENEKEDEVTAQKMEEEEEKQEIRKMDLDEEKEEGTPAVQTKADTAGVGTAGASVSTQITNSAGRGKPMNAKTKAEMEASFGSNFNG